MNKEKIKFEIQIAAPAEKVYSLLIDKEGYSSWTSAFNPDSRFEGSWGAGSEILFIGCDKDGNTEGMVSQIAENIPNEFISIKHLGLYKNGERIMSGDAVDAWAGGLENYRFTADGNTTKVIVEMESTEEYKSYFEETFPKALEKLKEICES